MKTDLFQSCGHCWVFQICWHIECSTFTVSSFRIWNMSTGIPSPPLALFIVMLPKAQLTSHSRMSGSRWVITPWWLSGLWRSFLYSSSVYSFHLLLISSASVRSMHKALGNRREGRQSCLLRGAAGARWRLAGVVSFSRSKVPAGHFLTHPRAWRVSLWWAGMISSPGGQGKVKWILFQLMCLCD